MNTHPTVLYVEDDSSSRSVMQLLLEARMKLPHITIFEDTVDFMPRIRILDPKPDVIFLDIHIEPLTGFEILELLRRDQDFQGIPVVALTASVMNEEVHQLKLAGFNGCLAKPIDIKEFPTHLHRIVNGEEIWFVT